MIHRGLLVEIEGVSNALVNSNQLTPTAYQGIQEVIVALSPSLSQQVSQDTAQSTLSGATLQVSDFSWAMETLATQSTTSLTADLSQTATTIDVDDTSLFDSSGVVWIGKEAIRYTGKTATTFEGCIRAYYRTSATQHSTSSTVYDRNPFVLGRQVWFYWQDYSNQTKNTLRWSGFLEAVEWDDVTTLTCVSPQKLLTDSQVCATTFGKGTLKEEIGPSGVVEMFVEFASADNRFSSYPTNPKQRPFVRIDSELVQIKSVSRDDIYYQEVNAVPAQSFEVVCNQPTRLEAGDTVDIEDASGTIKLAGVRILNVRKSYPNPGEDTITHSGDTTSLVAGDVLVNRYKQRLTIEQRGRFGTLPTKHEAGADVQEVRVLQGDQADLLLTMLFSLNGDRTNGPESGRFDTLPAGWGLGLSSDFVDLDSFDEIRLKSTFRRYLLTEPMNLEEYLTHLAMTTSALCIWQLDGRLKIKGRGDVYPQQKTTTIDNDALVITNENGALPSLVLDGSRIANIAKLSANYNVDGQALYSETIIESESVKFYGSRTLPGIDDKGIVYVGGVGELTATLEAILLERKAPRPLVSVTVLLDLDKAYEPGDLVSLTVQHLPDIQGSSTGYSATDVFEVVEVTPADDRATVALTLLLRRQTDRLCRVAPAARVNSVSSLDVQVESRANYGLTTANASDVSMAPESGEDGTEPVHWFLTGDKVQFVDASTLTSATPTFGSATITSVDYATATITVDAVPAWLASGDIVRFDDWDTFAGASTVGQRTDRFMWWADSNETLGSASDDPFLWGR